MGHLIFSCDILIDKLSKFQDNTDAVKEKVS